MKPNCPNRLHLDRRTASGLITALLLVCLNPAHAGPGAHGPNGEHLDAPAAGAAQGGSSPRVEAKSETFELVGHLEGGVLSLMIDRFDTNEPVLGAGVDVEAGAAKAKATFRPEQGDYVVSDPAMLKLLAEPKKHALVFTITAGTDSDLIDGALQPGATGSAADAGHATGMGIGAWVAIAMGFLAVVTFGVFVWRRRRAPYRMAGGLK